jgi:ABC-type sulfate/molybdate transport systems ATPase subunit
MVALLTVDDVRHRRADRDVLVVDTLAVADGERLAVLGPNGAGKTTLLRLLALVEPPTYGRVLVGGDDATALPDHARLAVRRRMSYLPQRPALLTGTVQRNVELPLAWRKVDRAHRRELVMTALERLGVAHLAGRRAQRLSGGESQRVALARALVTAPDVLLLDEPAAALDADARAAFLTDAERALADRRTTVVHVTHRVDDAVRLADRVAVLVEGSIRQLGAADEVLRHPADPAVARLVGYDNVVPVLVDDGGAVRLGELTLLPCGARRAGPATLAVWAAGLQVRPATRGEPCAVISALRAGPGRTELRMRVDDVELVAHLPPDAAALRPGDRVAVTALPAACAFTDGGAE